MTPPSLSTPEAPPRTIDIAPEEKRPDRLALAAFATIVLLGGLSAIAVRFSNRELAPFWGATLRFGASATLLWAVSAAWRLPLPRGPALRGTLLFGVLNFGFSFGLFYWGLQTVQAGLAQVVLALTPLLTIFLAVAHRQETLGWRPVLAGLTALAGIGIVFFDQLRLDVPLPALLALVLSALAVAEGSVILKSVRESHPIMISALAMSAGVVVTFALSRLAGEPQAAPKLALTWGALVYLVLIGSLTHMLMVFVIRRWTASATTYLFVLMPFVAVAAGAWLANEAITAGFLVGGVLVLAGAYAGAVSASARHNAR